LAGLLEQVEGAASPASVRGGGLRVTYRPDENCEVQIEALILLLPPRQFLDLARTTQDAARRLDEILSSGVWDEDDAEDAAPDIPGSIGRTPFSKN
jgi:hypothetical protein